MRKDYPRLNFSFLLFILLSLLTLSSLLLSQEVADESTIPLEEKIAKLSMIWSEVKYNFAFFDQVPDLDWDAEYKKKIAEVIACKSDLEYYKILQRFLASLEDGHTVFIWPESVRNKYDLPPINIMEVEGKPVVVAIDKSLVDQIPIGSVIVTVDGVEVMQYLATQVLPYISSSTEFAKIDMAMEGMVYRSFGMLLREKGSTVKIEYKTPDNDLREAELVCNRSDSDVEWLGRVKPIKTISIKWLENDIAYIQATNFARKEVYEKFHESIPELKKAKGVIIDLRFNGGGNTNYGLEILEHFTPKDTLVGTKWRTREHRAAHYAWCMNDPDSKFYDTYGTLNAWYENDDFTMNLTGEKLSCPLVVLQGHSTASAAEDFLVYCDQVESATLVGRPSLGSTGQPIFHRFEDGSAVIICTKRDTYPDGREFVGYGVLPDVPVEPTIESIAKGKDIVFEKGIEVLKEKISSK